MYKINLIDCVIALLGNFLFDLIYFALYYSKNKSSKMDKLNYSSLSNAIHNSNKKMNELTVT